MIRLEEALRRTATALGDQQWTLVGGLAVSVRCEPRFTRDIDIVVALADDEAAERLVSSMLGTGFRVLALMEQEAKGRLATVRLAIPGEAASGVVADLLFASSGIETEIAAGASPLEVFPGLVLPVARVGDLLAMKLLSRGDRRPQDAADLVALLASAEEAEVARAHESVRLIEQRGYARGRNLVSDLAALLASR